LIKGRIFKSNTIKGAAADFSAMLDATFADMGHKAHSCLEERVKLFGTIPDIHSWAYHGAYSPSFVYVVCNVLFWAYSDYVNNAEEKG
jgi:hypothetical protein